jgi:hypothetical protein
LDARRSAAATQRNREPIFEVLSRWLPARGRVLELASGTGEHVVWLAQRLPGLLFVPSDPDPESRASIAAWTAHEGVANVRPPLALATTDPDWQASPGVPEELAAILCINLLHVAPWPAALGLARGAAAALEPGGLLYLYGPYRRGGRHTAPSNEAFDASLRARDPAWGVRDLEAVLAACEGAGLALAELVAMPANNLSVLLRRRAGAPAAQAQR